MCLGRRCSMKMRKKKVGWLWTIVFSWHWQSFEAARKREEVNFVYFRKDISKDEATHTNINTRTNTHKRTRTHVHPHPHPHTRTPAPVHVHARTHSNNEHTPAPAHTPHTLLSAARRISNRVVTAFGDTPSHRLTFRYTSSCSEILIS